MMAEHLNTFSQTKTIAPAIAAKVLPLVAKAKYEAPKIASFPLDGMDLSESMTLSGNI